MAADLLRAVDITESMQGRLLGVFGNEALDKVRCNRNPEPLPEIAAAGQHSL